MLYWVIPVITAVVLLLLAAKWLGWSLPSAGNLTISAPAWAAAWWTANWALVVIFLPLLVLAVFVVLPALPIGYSTYASHGGATGWVLVSIIMLLVVAFTIPQSWLRIPAAIVLGALLAWVTVPAATWTVLGYCSPADLACKREAAAAAAVKAEAERRREIEAAARRASIPQQPVSADCNVDRKAHYFPSGKPAYKFNPGGKCAPALFIDGHCVYVTQNGSDKTLGPICNNGDGVPRDRLGNKTDMPEDIDRVWSAGEPFSGSIGLWQPRYTKLFSWR